MIYDSIFIVRLLCVYALMFRQFRFCLCSHFIEEKVSEFDILYRDKFNYDPKDKKNIKQLFLTMNVNNIEFRKMKK